MTQPCIHFKDEICDSAVMNTKTCNNCLISRQTTTLVAILDRLKIIEDNMARKPARKTPVRKTK